MKPSARVAASIIGDHVRITLAIALSFLLHVLLLLLVPAPAEHVDYLMAQPALPALSVRIALPSLPPDPGGPPPVRIEPRRPPIPVEKARTETSAQPPGEAPQRPLPFVPLPQAPRPATYAGVNSAPSLYLGPLPPRAIEFAGGPDYLRESQLDEAPVAVSIAIPEIPPAAPGEESGGTVLVAIFIDEEGQVVRTAVVESSEHVFRYSGQIARAMAHSVFTPRKKDGKAVKSLVFQLVRLDPALPAPSL